jgi:hypothetical protein
MKQGQSQPTLRASATAWSTRGLSTPHLRSSNAPLRPAPVPGRKLTKAWVWAELLVALLGTIGFAVALPFRLLFWLIALLGRVTGVMVGFVLMVIGMALWASPLFFFGIPLFLLGLVFTLRCLE